MHNYNKSNIIVLALLYNYISNNSIALETKQIEHFFNELNYELFLNFSNTINEIEYKEQKIYQYNDGLVSLSEIYIKPQSLKYVKKIYIDILPKEIIELSLSPNVLVTINACNVNFFDIYEEEKQKQL